MVIFRLIIPMTRPIISCFKLRFLLTAIATGITKLTQPKKFMIKPIIPLLLIVINCRNGTAKHMSKLYMGFSKQAAKI